MKMHKYECNVCGVKKAEADLIGFRWDDNDVLKEIDKIAINFICKKCLKEFSYFPSLRKTEESI